LQALQREKRRAIRELRGRDLPLGPEHIRREQEFNKVKKEAKLKILNEDIGIIMESIERERSYIIKEQQYGSDH
jgi:hypothetical protein